MFSQVQSESAANRQESVVSKCGSMNNLNDPPRWNIRPDQRGGGDGNKWNYALLVPMLGLAAFRWIWTRESQKEIQEVKATYEKDMKSIKKDLELKYQDIITENRRAAAHLELELEKEHSRVQGYRDALISQSRKLLEERKLLQQEREKIEKEKRQLLHSGAAAALYRSILEKESDWQNKATFVLKQFEEALVERQSAFCSILVPRDRRLEMEKNLLIKAATDPVAVELKMEADLKNIFKHDRYCADLLNTDKRKNGRLMWLFLKQWELQVELQKFKRAEKSLLEAQSN
ncbi:coiled-coil domain-containing protein 127-like [Acipenser oxyrinchus oxyrinchus]|uniref:Coiled-coil domain-containing protein 127-like n=1 Tax=Acipenser oxyrinchus oxyrinchus TaxID=40147 RepID=A0AAD8GF74_ACIOX|nr:coiled-coil domain-containing protein 127-like [Acipenser oxyrinchus oxyrinchus]